MANRIKKGDQVVVTAGKDKGKQGEVIRVDGDRVVVSTSTWSSGTPSRTRRRGSPAAWSSARARSTSQT